MADPATMAVGGAAAGAMLDRKNPIRGAALGGMGGYFVGPSLGALGGAVPGVAAGSEQAAMLAAQNAGLGAAGDLATAEAAATAIQPSMVPGLSFGKNMAMGGMGGMGGGQNMAMQGAMGLMKGQQQPQMQRPMPMGGMAMPMNPNAGGSFSQMSPFTRQAFGPGGMPQMPMGMSRRGVMPL